MTLTTESDGMLPTSKYFVAIACVLIMCGHLTLVVYVRQHWIMLLTRPALHYGLVGLIPVLTLTIFGVCSRNVGLTWESFVVVAIASIAPSCLHALTLYMIRHYST